MTMLARLKALFGVAPVAQEQDQPQQKDPQQEHAPWGDRGAETVLDFVQAAPIAERRNRRRHNARPGTKILIIDDSPTVVAALRGMFISAGYVVLSASDAAKGLAIARTERPALIFLDIVLPGMDGFAALRILRREPWTFRIPVIMISGNALAAEQYYANHIGADDFMKKPFSRFEVFARIECLLGADNVPRRWTRIAPDTTTTDVDLGMKAGDA